MAIKTIIKMGNPILREIAQELSTEEILSDQTSQLITDMIDTMKALGGIGIAAPQIGISKSVAIINIDTQQSRYEIEESIPMLKIFNPKIKILDEELQGFWEGCLSVPGLRGYVQRPQKIEVTYLDEEANEQIIIAQGFTSTVFQHELDHLFGKIYVDRIKDLSLLGYEDELMSKNAKSEGS